MLSFRRGARIGPIGTGTPCWTPAAVCARTSRGATLTSCMMWAPGLLLAAASMARHFHSFRRHQHDADHLTLRSVRGQTRGESSKNALFGGEMLAAWSARIYVSMFRCAPSLNGYMSSGVAASHLMRRCAVDGIVSIHLCAVLQRRPCPGDLRC